MSSKTVFIMGGGAFGRSIALRLGCEGVRVLIDGSREDYGYREETAKIINEAGGESEVFPAIKPEKINVSLLQECRCKLDFIVML